MIALLTLALLAGAETPLLTQARQRLEKGDLDGLVLALEEVPPESALPASDLLARGATKARQTGDDVLALQLVQMALRQNKRNPAALEVGAKLYFASKDYGPAEELSDRWISVSPDEAPPKLLRAQLALEQGDWDACTFLVTQLKGPLTADQRAQAKVLIEISSKERRERKHGERALANLERRRAQVELAAAQAEKSRRATHPVILYRTAWCGYCRKAASYFKEKGVAFVEKDIDQDGQANEELRKKSQLAGIPFGGVPVVDIGGKLVRGFNPPRYDALLP